jgi:osmotically-inducible protein OsmY
MNLTLAAVVIMGGWAVVIVLAGLVMALRPGGVTVRLATAGGSASAVTGRRDEILLGGEAEAFGNVRGRVREVLFGPQDHQLEAVALTGGLDERDVPANAIVSADGRVLRLRDGWAEADPIASESRAARLRENATVVSAEGKHLGKLRLVCFEPVSGLVTALVVEGRGTPRLRLVPLSRVKEAGPHRVVTDLTSAEWTGLPAFATDWEIRQAILDRLAADPELQALPRSLRIDVQDQRVAVQGYVANRAQVDRLSQLVRSIPGVLNPDVDVVTDEDQARAVREALGRAQATAAARVQVNAHHGTVEITGEAPDRSTMRSIDAVAREVPGVQVVHNMVGVPTASRTP